MEDRTIEQFPHCDSRILHAPGECKFCDMHPDWQELRKVWGINFTGGTERGLSPCPADHARGSSHQRWHGNRPETAETERQREEYYRKLNEELRLVTTKDKE